MEIIEFLITAKKATYAGKGAETEPSRPNSHDLHYSDGDLQYIDTFLGGEKFIGEEALWRNNVPFWGMNYVGRVLLADNFSGDFLKEALSNVPKEKPYRGPENYQNGKYRYKCSVEGDFEWFKGYEEIFYEDEKIYELFFHGGNVV
jgi:hypothetical protein